MNGNINTSALQTSMIESDDKISSTISKLLEHPELISMVASAIGVRPPESAANNDAVSVNEENTSDNIAEPSADNNTVTTSTPSPHPAISGDILTSVMPMISKLSSIGNISSGKRSWRHEALLCALKPYLSESRSQAVDYIIRISQISEIIGKLR